MRIDYIIFHIMEGYHFDLRDSHPPLGPTPIAEFHCYFRIVVELF